MDVLGYYQFMRVATPPTTDPGQNGVYAFCESNGRLYRYFGSTWEMVPNQSEIGATSRKALINGTAVNGVTPYLCKTTTGSGGIATLWLTDNGTSTGNAVFSSIHPEGISILAYGTGNNYQVFNVAVAADRKSVTCSVNQLAPAILGLVSVTSAATGVDIRGIVLGTLINP